MEMQIEVGLLYIVLLQNHVSNVNVSMYQDNVNVVIYDDILSLVITAVKGSSYI